MFDTNSIISIVDSIGTIKSLQEIDNDLTTEMLKEAQIINTLSIVNVAKDELNM